MGQTAGSVFGSTDGLDSGGNKLGQNASADQLGLTKGQMFARKAIGNSLTGIAKGAPSMGAQIPNPGASAPINVPQAPQVDPTMFGMGRPKNPFYGM